MRTSSLPDDVPHEKEKCILGRDTEVLPVNGNLLKA